MSIDGSQLKVTVEEQERWRRRVSVTVPAALVAEEEKKAAAKLASRVNMKGFRKGRVPKAMVSARFGGALRQEALDQLINHAYREALASRDLRPISEGELEDLSYEPQQDLTFSIAFDIQPVIELDRLGGFVVERPRTQVGDEHVDEVLQNLRTQNGAWKPVDEGNAQDGNLASVRIRRLDGESEEEGKEYEFALGEGQAIPEVEEAVKSLDLGGSGEFTVTFPDDFPDESRRGAKERVEIALLGRKVMELPELDDAFARQLGDFESLDALKARILEDLKKDAVDQAESVVRGRLLDFLVEANPFEVPQSMTNRYAEGILGGQSKIPEERKAEIMENIRPEAERAVKRLMVLDRIAQARNLDTTEEEIDQRIEEIAERNGSTPEKIYASFQKAGRLEALEREITERKVFDFLKSQSEITDAPAT